jgi:hypothetical protein
MLLQCSTLGGSRPTLGADTYTGTKGGYDYEGSVDAGGNYTAGTAQGVQFAPQTSIDPYAAFTGSAPQGLVQSAYNPYPVQPMSMSPIDDLVDPVDPGDSGDYGGGGDDFSGGGGYYGGDPYGGDPFNGGDYYYADQRNGGGGYYGGDLGTGGKGYYNMGGFDPTSFDPTSFPMERAEGGVTNYANQGQTEIMPMDVMPEASAQPMQDPLIQEVTMFILG